MTVWAVYHLDLFLLLLLLRREKKNRCLLVVGWAEWLELIIRHSPAQYSSTLLLLASLPLRNTTTHSRDLEEESIR